VVIVPDPIALAGRAWRWLRRMRSALYLLGLLAIASMVGTIVPQRPNVAPTVDAWLAGTEGPGAPVARALDWLGVFDVFGAPWFTVLLVLLFTSLTSCLIPRYRAWWRTWRRAEAPPARTLDQAHAVRIDAVVPSDRALEVAADVLRRHRFRVTRHTLAGDRVQIAGERGRAMREGSSLLFHTAFYALLIAIVSGQLLGFSGQVAVVEGESWAETAVGYWSYRPGRWWGPEDHRGFVLTLDRFEVDWYEDGTPKTFLSHVTVDRGDGPTPERVGGNDPVVVDGMKIHQLDWGYAAHVLVRAEGRVVHDRVIVLRRTSAGFFRGVVKAPGPDPDVALALELYPHLELDATGAPVVIADDRPVAPVLLFSVLRGDVRLDRVQDVTTLDRTALEQVGDGAVRPGDSATVAGVTVEFPELRRWVGFQISHRPTAPLLLLASTLLLTGLVPSLYASRRRVWVEAGPQITVAGTALQRPHAFEQEFAAIVADLTDRLSSGQPAREREVVGT